MYVIIHLVFPNREVISMTRLELLTVLLSIKKLLECDKTDKALELINEVIAEAKRYDKKGE